MRTTNKVQETENKTISKTISKTFAIVISLVLISFTVSAQGFWKQILVNNTYGKMAELMVKQKNADDQLMNANTHCLEPRIAIPVIHSETAQELTFEYYFNSQWTTNQTEMKEYVQPAWRLEE